MKRLCSPTRLPLLAGLAAAVLIIGDGKLRTRLTAQQPAPPERTTQPAPERPGQPAAGRTTQGTPDERAIGPLNDAYDALQMVTALTGSNQVKVPREDAALLDQTKELYRRAHKAYQDGHYRRAAQLALAAADAATGLIYDIQATAPSMDGIPAPPAATPAPLPMDRGTPPAGRDVTPPRDKPVAPPARDRDAPPPPPARDRDAPPPPARDRDTAPRQPADRTETRQGPAEGLRGMIRDVRERMQDDADEITQGTGKQFLDASRRALDRAQNALSDNNYRQAGQFAMAADSWLRVGEYVNRAEHPGTGTSPREPASPAQRQPAPER